MIYNDAKCLARLNDVQKEYYPDMGVHKCIRFVLVFKTSQLARVPTSSGNHGKPGKSLKISSMHRKSWNLKKTLNNHGKIMEFCEII